MWRVFVDASVLFAAAYSTTGSSREVVRFAIEGSVQVVLGEYVLEEAERNLALKAPAALRAFRELIELIAPEVVGRPTASELSEAAAYINVKDAPVIAAAVKAGADCLVTWDRKHFIDVPGVAMKSGLLILTPEELLTRLRHAR